MAYAAVLSFVQILRQIQKSDEFQDTHYPKTNIEHLYGQVGYLKYFLETNVPKLHKNESINLERQIRDTIHEAEELIESHISTHFLSSEDQSYNYWSIFTEDLERVIEQIDSTAERAREIFESPPHNSNDGYHNFSTAARMGRNVIVGREKDIDELKVRLFGPSRLEVIPIVGVSGIGKTALAEKVYKDPFIRDHFETRAWIKLSHKNDKRDVLIGLLRCVKKLDGSQWTDDQLVKSLYKFFKRRRYLIVFDNICDAKTWNDLKELFIDCNNGSRIMLTTRNMDVAHVDDIFGPLHRVSFMSEDESWDLFREIVFEKQTIPKKCRNIAYTIAVNCKGLPLAMVLIGRLLPWISLTEWMTVESSIQTCETYVELIGVVLSLSYDYLFQFLKPCILYMGIFPHDYEIRVSVLIKLWISEGLIETEMEMSATFLEFSGEEYLKILTYRGLITACRRSSDFRIELCRVNDFFLDFLKKKAEEEKFFHIIDENTNGFLEGRYDQRRLCIHNNNLFGIRDVSKYNTMASTSIARSLIYFGSGPEYPLRAWLAFKLLRVLNILKIRFYNFPLETLKLFQLTYLALSYNGELPASVCKLWNLKVLIVRRYINIKRFGAPVYLPMEIWNMKELSHLQVMGSDLPDPSTTNASDLLLENLVTLLDVSAHSCTAGVLQRIPNLKKLGIRIESISAGEVADTFSVLSNLVVLEKLLSLKCIVMHPDLGSQVVSPIQCIFPRGLKKLTLSGFGFSWEYMSVIATLPRLRVQKLRHYAFRGPVWDPCEGGFRELQCLLLEDMDIEYWLLSNREYFPFLKRLIIRHCYKLRDIPFSIGKIPKLEMVEVVDCSPSDPLISARQIREGRPQFRIDALEVQILNSWND